MNTVTQLHTDTVGTEANTGNVIPTLAVHETREVP